MLFTVRAPAIHGAVLATAAMLLAVLSASAAHAHQLRDLGDFGVTSRAVITADFNSDSFPDLAVASDCKVNVLLGHGTGTFKVAAAARSAGY